MFASSFAHQVFCCAQGGDNSVFVDMVEIFDIGTDITVDNADFEENPEVASYEYKLPNGWDGSGGGTVVVKSPPSAPNGPWGAASASAQGAANGDYFMSIRA